MTENTTQWRPWARHALAAAAILCTTLAGLSILSFLAAGTLQMDGDYPDGAGHLLFASLAPVHFYGVLPTNATQMPTSFLDPDSSSSAITWQVKMSLFLNAFGWEWPDSPTWENSVGIVRNVDGVLSSSPALDLPLDLATVRRQLGLDETDSWCLPPGWEAAKNPSACTNVFFTVWASHQREVSTVVESLLYYFLGCLLLGIAVQEIVVRMIPRVVRCSCPDVIRRRGWCSCWKMDEDGPVLTAAVRNRIRVRNLEMFGVAHLLVTGAVLYKAYSLKSFVDGVDRELGGGMQAGLGWGFLAVSCATWVAVAVAVACLNIRQGLSEPDINYSLVTDSCESGDEDEDNVDEEAATTRATILFKQ